MLTPYATGKRYVEFIGPESCRIDLADSGLQLLLLYAGPTQQEIEDVSAGHPFSISIGEKDGVVFFFAKFGDSETIDMPFSMHLARCATLPDIGPGQGLALTVYLADCLTGELKNIRLIGLAESFSRSVVSILRADAARPFDMITQNRKISEIYRRYTTQQLLTCAADRFYSL